MRLGTVILIGFLLKAVPGQAGVEEAVVKVGGCSGVCVDPAGLVLTARHCDLPDVVLVEFSDRTASAHRLYATSESDGPVAYDCDGENFPYASLAASVPAVGTRVWSAGYPDVGGARPLRRASGALLHGATFSFRGGSFRGNVVCFPTGPGWSGGPLFNERGEVCGLLSSGDCATSVFLSFAATKQAYEIARANLPESDKPTLYIFGSMTCGPCKAFRKEYDNDSAFRQKLNDAFHVIFVDVEREQSTAKQFGVSEVPAFVIADGTRVVGYPGREALLAQLGITKSEIAAPAPPEPPQVDTVEAKKPEPPADKPAAVPPTGNVASNPAPPASVPSSTNDEPKRTASDERLDRILGAAQTAVTIAKWLGITGATGGVGGLVLGGIALLRTIRRARRGQSARDPPASKPTVVTVDTPPPPQAIVPETRFAPYERDTFAEAFAWAETEMARKYPGAVGTLESLRSLIDQYLSAKGVKKTPATPN